MTAAGQVTLGEVNRKLDDLIKRVDEGFAHTVTPDVYDAHRETDAERMQAVAARLTKVEGTITWITRTLGGVIITIVVTGILIGNKVHP